MVHFITCCKCVDQVTFKFVIVLAEGTVNIDQIQDSE